MGIESVVVNALIKIVRVMTNVFLASTSAATLTIEAHAKTLVLLPLPTGIAMESVFPGLHSVTTHVMRLCSSAVTPA